jgi:ribosomal protein S17
MRYLGFQVKIKSKIIERNTLVFADIYGRAVKSETQSPAHNK